jgi:hypothetical protein
MPTLVTRYVNTASSGGDGTTNATSGANAAYASLSAANTDITADYPSFVASDVQVDVYCTGSAADTANFTITGITTDATRYLRILAASGDVARANGWDTGRYRLSATNPSSPLNTLVISIAHIRLIGLQIECVGTSGLNSRSNLVINAGFASGNNILIDSCRLRYTATSVGTGCDVFTWSSAGNTPRVINTIIEAVGTQRTSVRTAAINSNDDGAIYNCLLTGGSVAFEDSGGSGTPVLKNCILYNNNANTTSGHWNASSTNNASDRADVEGSNQRESQTFTFEDAANGDYRITSADAAARNFGTDLSADATQAFAVDMAGTSRPQGASWDIGPFEVAAATTFFRPYFITG